MPTSEGSSSNTQNGVVSQNIPVRSVCLTLSCNTAGDTVDWKASHGRGHCKSTIEWFDLSESELDAEDKRSNSG